MYLAVLVCMLAGSVAAQQCVQPTNGQRITTDTLFCEGTYSFSSGITIEADVVLECAGATLRGSGTGTGIAVVGDDVQVRNCGIQNYAIGLLAQNVQGFVESGLSFSGNVQDRDIGVGEDITVSPQDQTEQTQPTSQPSGTPEPTGGRPGRDQPVTINQSNTSQTDQTAPRAPPLIIEGIKRNTSIWLVADIKSEALLENALSFEYSSGDVPEEVLARRIAELEQTLQDVRIRREFVYVGGVTQVRIMVVPQSGFFRRVIFENVTLYEYIPKCFAQLVDEVVFEGEQPTVLERDPLLKKVIRKGEPLQLLYGAKNLISPQCKELFRLVAVGSGKRVDTLSSVLADRGVKAVLLEFPLESATVVVFFSTIAGIGVWYKRQTHLLKR